MNESVATEQTAPDASASSPKPRQTVAAFLTVLHGEGSVFEVRVPQCPEGHGGFSATRAGYFNDINRAVEEIVNLDTHHKPPAIYCTLNPVNPDLLARANNRTVSKVKNTSADADVVKRTFVIVDIDPRRPAGISATDAEKQAALQCAEGIRQDLARKGWPEPLVCMSGNGAYLIYRIDLPNTAESADLIRNLLQTLAQRYDTDAVEIDTSVYNAARIVKVIGTTARKGDPTDDRPHRRSRIVCQPEHLLPVPLDRLKAIAATPAPDDPTSEARPMCGTAHRSRLTQGDGRFKTFDDSPVGVRQLLDEYGVGVRKEQTISNGIRIILERCPITGVESNGDTSVAVIRYNDGRIIYKNQHNRGAGLGWHDLRDHFEPGYKAHIEACRQRRNEAQASQGAVNAVLEAARETGVDAVFSPDAIQTLASLSAADYAKAKLALREILGKRLNLADLGSAIREARTAAERQATSTDGSDDAPNVRAVWDALDVLGQDQDGRVVLYGNDVKRVQIASLSHFSYEDAVLLSGKPISESYVLRPSRGDPRLPFDQLKTEIALKARTRHLNSGKRKGQGIWPGESNGVLVIDGNSAVTITREGATELASPIMKDTFVELDGSRTWCDIRLLIERVHTLDLSGVKAVVQRLLCIVAQWRFRYPHDPQLVVGLILATAVQTLWSWRPQVWLSGRTQTGKTLLFLLVEFLLGALAIRDEGKTSEAGLRQRVRRDASYILLDEFEKNRHRERILELLRSSSRGGTITKGTPGQKPIIYGLQHIAWVASIEVGLRRAADLNRFIVLHTVPLDAGEEAPRLPGRAEFKELSLDLIATAVWLVPQALDVYERLRDTAIDGVNPRLVDSYAVPLAMLCAAAGSSMEEAKTSLREFLAGRREVREQAESDESLLLQTIFASKIRVPIATESGSGRFNTVVYHERTVGQLLESEDHEETLAAHGIKAGQRGIFVVPETVVRELLKGTQWERLVIGEILERVPGAAKKRLRVGGIRHRGVVVPWPDD